MKLQGYRQVFVLYLVVGFFYCGNRSQAIRLRGLPRVTAKHTLEEDVYGSGVMAFDTCCAEPVSVCGQVASGKVFVPA